jgi:DNA-binding CsgD family transcriptional regulator
MNTFQERIEPFPKDSRPHARTSVSDISGFLLLDSAMKPLYINEEAVRILAYPKTKIDPKSADVVMGGVLQTMSPSVSIALMKSSVTHITSGRRHYTCRFILVSVSGHDRQHPTAAVLIERDPMATEVRRMAQKFKLTQREQQAVQLLALGLTSKEIASQMGISPHTVKAFLRLIMIKTGATTRSGVIGKLLRSA